MGQLGLIVNEGKNVDASFIEVPKQRNSREKTKQIKNGDTNDSEQAKQTPKSFDENPNKKEQKDLDAR